MSWCHFFCSVKKKITRPTLIRKRRNAVGTIEILLPPPPPPPFFSCNYIKINHCGTSSCYCTRTLQCLIIPAAVPTVDRRFENKRTKLGFRLWFSELPSETTGLLRYFIQRCLFLDSEAKRIGSIGLTIMLISFFLSFFYTFRRHFFVPFTLSQSLIRRQWRYADIFCTQMVLWVFVFPSSRYVFQVRKKTAAKPSENGEIRRKRDFLCRLDTHVQHGKKRETKQILKK